MSTDPIDQEWTLYQNVKTWSERIAKRAVAAVSYQQELDSIDDAEWEAYEAGAMVALSFALDELMKLGALDLDGVRKISASGETEETP